MAVALVAGVVSGTAFAKNEYVYGPEPNWTRYKALAEPAVRTKIPDAKLGDPANWSIEWPNGYARIGWRHKGSFNGYFTCGYLRPLAPVNGRLRRVNFVAVVDHDQVQTVDISSRESNSLVNVMCDALVAHGSLPPANLMNMPVDTTIDPLGITMRPMPEGAYVVSVTKGSRAGSAGLKLGMVLTRVNGIALANMGSAMASVLGAGSPTLVVETATGERIDLRKAP